MGHISQILAGIVFPAGCTLLMVFYDRCGRNAEDSLNRFDLLIRNLSTMHCCS